jgi:hypothetical protein
VKKVLLGAAFAAAVLVPVASASSAQSVKLALAPLPKSALGAAARNLPIAPDSGVVSNPTAASEANGHVTPQQLTRLGRVTGYLLDYGNPFGTSSGIREVQTEIERYRSAADARRGLAFWRRNDLQTTGLKGLGIHFSARTLGLAGLPKPNWAHAETISITGLQPIRGVDAELQQGQYLLDVAISARSSSAASHLAARVGAGFERRFRLALAGGLRGHPVKLPPARQAGPPARGPKPAALALRAADLGSSAKVVHSGYSKPKNSFDQNALSVYSLTMTSGGTYPLLSQEVIVGENKLAVRYFAAIAASGAAAGAGGGHATTVDLSGVGDNARGVLLAVSISGQTADEAVVVLSRGSYLDIVVAAGPSAFSAAQFHNLAGMAAKRLNAGLTR